jgi:hypothetical protein
LKYSVSVRLCLDFGHPRRGRKGNSWNVRGAPAPARGGSGSRHPGSRQRVCVNELARGSVVTSLGWSRRRLERVAAELSTPVVVVVVGPRRDYRSHLMRDARPPGCVRGCARNKLRLLDGTAGAAEAAGAVNSKISVRPHGHTGWFSWRKSLDSATVTFFVLFDNLCLIMD